MATTAAAPESCALYLGGEIWGTGATEGTKLQVWYGMVWYRIVWSGIVWYGMVWVWVSRIYAFRPHRDTSTSTCFFFSRGSIGRVG